MSRRFRVTANFPVLEAAAHQTVIVEGSNWQVALGKAAREFKRLPIMHRRRVTALSMMVEQIGQPADVHEQPASEETIMEGQPEQQYTDAEVNQQLANEDAEAAAGEALNQQANDEAERLIADGQAVDDTEDIT